MGSELPQLSFVDFVARLRRVDAPSLEVAAETALYAHFQELRRWNRSLSLIGPGTTADVVERHYGESLAALELLGPAPSGRLVDVGSGAGFPGLVLAAACPGLEVSLYEARQKKVEFLTAAARHAGIVCDCRHLRMGVPLPAGVAERIDFLTLRAVRMSLRTWQVLIPRMSRGGRILLWVGRELPEIPSGLVVLGERRLRPSRSRRIVALGLPSRQRQD